ncbi:MAG: class I SAM-dependent methyltransferase [Phycisphaerales bacterium]|nr:class I SAM-dependent methyltransferase [Phycisphaerales bacterium]
MASVWDLRARLYDVCEGSQLRRAPFKTALFREMTGRTLFVAIGTGADILQFPPDRDIVAIDISAAMLRRAEPRRRRYRGDLRLIRMDALQLEFPAASFDTVVTSCTMCSVPDAATALRELHRVLRPGGRLLMFEHVRSRNVILARALDLMTLWTRFFGTEMNRDTVTTVRAAGFRITRIESVYLDIILTIRATRS